MKSFQKVSRTSILSVLALIVFCFPLLSYSESQAANRSEETQITQPTEPVPEDSPNGFLESVLPAVNEAIFGVLFFDISGGAIQNPEVDRAGNPVLDDRGQPKIKTTPLPLLIVVLGLGAIFFTFYYGFINLRAFKHSIDVVRGRFDKDDDHGEISHFRALTSALSATVGLGNIAGVALAIQTGGPGAVVWMMIMAIFGMSAKFGSCTLAQLFRKVNPDGSVAGGPMYYLDLGLREKGKLFAALGKVLAVIYAVMVMGASFGGGNMFQSNQTAEAFRTTFGLSESADLYIGLTLALLVAVVILGGIRRIAAATSKIVPLMCGLYILASLVVIISNIQAIPEAVATMFRLAFSENAFFGGAIGVMVMGVQRAAFSNEAGLGSAAIAHAAAKTNEPVREGLVAMIGPFIDTIVICFMTSMVIVVTGVWTDPSLASISGNVGVALTSAAFSSAIPWFPYVLTICIGFFAYSTMISWCYYGEVGWIYLLDHFGGMGKKTVNIFRVFFILATVLGAVTTLSEVLDFSDAMVLSMAFPNIVGSIILAPLVLKKLKDYWARLQSGEMQRTK